MRKAIIGLLLSSICHTCLGMDGAMAKVFLKVVDENGNPVQNASVSAGFWSPVAKNERGDQVEGQTDTNGLFVITGRAFTDMGYTVTNAGFYRTHERVLFHDFPNAQKRGIWEPYGMTNVVLLKRIRNPTAMYVKRVEATVPVTGQDVGYDLTVGDWVNPNGKGCVSDLVFNVSAKYRDPWNRRIKFTLTFANEKDGIQLFSNRIDENGKPTGSRFHSDHMAPETGYEGRRVYEMIYENEQPRSGLPGLTKGTSVVPQKEQPNVNFYLRVRSKTNETGQITSALYGKVYGHILADFAGDSDKEKYPQVYFTYYLNPTPNDRNIEFDPKRNIFTNLKSTERVTAP